MEKEKSAAKLLQEKICTTRKNGGLRLSADEIKTCFDYCEDYKSFLDDAKTEREAVVKTVTMAEKCGFVEFKYGMSLKAGDKIYYNNRGKAVILAIIGSEPIENGVHLAAAHIDSPRLDLKQNPLYEDNETAFFKTHYYGGIKKYQWTAIPLALHGVVVKKDGTKVSVNIGEDESDPVFCITDLLPHLAADQMKRTPGELIKGEELNILVGSLPFKDDEVSDKVKLNIMSILNEKYGMIEADFLSAELEVVPAFKAKDVGLDRSMIGAYGHDDRVCSYPALRALLDCADDTHTLMCVLADKEETGSIGVTGMQSQIFTDLMEEIALALGANPRVVRGNSSCLSADVTAGFDPNFAEVYEKRNSAILGCGVAMSKYTGSRGKSGTSDANAEFVGKIRNMLDANGVVWQSAELGKVDEGGGGTVAAYIANRNIDTLDIGVPVISMHAPIEVVSKVDVYAAYEAFLAFCK